MSSYKNIALAGASGSLGSVILERLRAHGFNVKVLRRTGSSSTFPEGVNVVDVDYSSVEQLTAALKGQDALVSAVGSMQIAVQDVLVDAAVAARVKRFLPSDFGSNLANAKTRQLPVFTHKVKIQDYLVEKAKTSDLTYTFVCNNAFLDWGLEHGFLLKTSDYKPTIIDGGDIIFSATTLSSVGDAVAGIMNHPEETKNRFVHIEDIKISQNKLLELSKKVAPEKPWAPAYVKLDDLTANADARLAAGKIDMETFAPYLFRAVLDPTYEGNFHKTDNELLGIKGRTEADVVEILKRNIK